MRFIEVLILVFLIEIPAVSYPCSANSPLGSLAFLVGEWVAEPDSNPLSGLPDILQSRNLSAHYELRQWVLIVRSGEEQSEGTSRLTGRGVEYVMVIYSGCGSDRQEGAVYIDTGSHRVHRCTFEVLYSQDRSRPIGVTFTSAMEPNDLGSFRLTYKEVTSGKIRVEIGNSYANTTASRYFVRAQRLPTQ